MTNTASLPIPKLRLDDPASYVTRWSWNNDSLCTLQTLPGGQKLQRIYESDFDNSTRARKRADCRVVREIASEPVDSDGDFVPDATERTWRYNYEPGFGSDPTPDRAAFHAINKKGIPGGSSKPKGMAAAKGIISSKPGIATPKGMVIHTDTSWIKVDNTDSVTDGSANKVNQTSNIYDGFSDHMFL